MASDGVTKSYPIEKACFWGRLCGILMPWVETLSTSCHLAHGRVGSLYYPVFVVKIRMRIFY